MSCCKINNNYTEDIVPIPKPQRDNTGFIILVLFILLAIIVGTIYSY